MLLSAAVRADGIGSAPSSPGLDLTLNVGFVGLPSFPVDAFIRSHVFMSLMHQYLLSLMKRRERS
jgi:hypothetical protein